MGLSPYCTLPLNAPQMKCLVTVIACFVLVSMSAQTPYKLDSESDNLVDFNDSLVGGKDSY